MNNKTKHSEGLHRWHLQFAPWTAHGGLRVRIHRGTQEIGGSCIELEAAGQRIVLDLGRPLSAKRGEVVPLPPVAGLGTGDDPSLLAVLISHPHQDHWGLVDQVPESVPVYLGDAATRVLAEAQYFGGSGLGRPVDGHYEHRTPFSLGPFTITPYLVDHSAYDAYAFLVEAGGKRLFYSGDFRAHGHKHVLFEQLVGDPPPDIDLLLMEGTHVRPQRPGTTHEVPRRGPSEVDLVAPMTGTFSQTSGLALVSFSAQNIDRLITVYEASRAAGRELVLDLYSAAVAAAIENPLVPQAGWPGVRVWLPQNQRVRIKKTGAFGRVEAIRSVRVFPEALARKPERFVLLFRSSMAVDLERVSALAGASLTWSLWPGYLDQPSGQHTRRWLARHGIDLVHHHSSGHAYIPDLQRFVRGLAPRTVVPIHSFAPGRFSQYFDCVYPRQDGPWWEVA